MSLAQDIRNAYDWRDRDALERALAYVQQLEDRKWLDGAQPCCGQYGTCARPCTPRGAWQAQQDREKPVVSGSSSAYP